MESGFIAIQPIDRVGQDTMPRGLPSESRREGTCMPNATVVTVAGAAHPLEMINPKGFNEAVLQFLEQH